MSQLHQPSVTVGRLAVCVMLTVVCGGCNLQLRQNLLSGKGSVTVRGDNRTIPANGLRGFDVQVAAGTVRVFSDASGPVTLTLVRHLEADTDEQASTAAAETKVTAEVNGGTLVVRDIVPSSWKSPGKPRNARLDLDLHIPTGLSGQVKLGAGKIVTSGKFGSLSMENGAGTVSASTLQCSGDLRATSSAGDVRLSSVTPSGDTVVVGAGAGAARVSLVQTPRTSVEVTSGAGGAELRLPAAVKATVRIEAAVGQATSDFAEVQPTGSSVVGRTLAGSINGGGASVLVRSSAGGAKLVRL